MMRGGGPLGVDCDAGGSAKLLAQGLTLLLAEALDPAVLGDADLLHQPAGLNLAHSGQGFEEGDHLEATDGIVRVGPVEGLHVYISQLRRKLADAAPDGSLRDLIVAEPGVGYRVRSA